MRRIAIILKKELSVLVLIWALAASFQTVYFYTYYQQPLSNSVRWSLVDWFTWVSLLALLVKTVPRNKLVWSRKNLPIIICFTLAIGGLHIIVSNALNGILVPPDRSFLDDFLHLYQKRWFQNILIFIVFSKMIEQTLLKKPDVTNNETSNPQIGKFRIFDGQNTVWLDYGEIRYMEICGNYLIIYGQEKQFITRQTLKNVEDKMCGHGFLKVNRSCIVNPDYIKSSERVSRSCVKLFIDGGGEVIISRKFWPNIKSLLNL